MRRISLIGRAIPIPAPDGGDWPDNAFRFGALSWVAARIALGDVAGFAPDIVHGHDWQAGLAMAYLAYEGERRPATVLTVHNLAYQGQFPPDLLERLRLPPHAFAIDGVENYGMIGFLKAGLQFADRITTVSPTYAQEIQTSDNGCGLDGLLRLRSRCLSGIRNGIDMDVWNPETDPRIAVAVRTFDLPTRDAEQGCAAATVRPQAGSDAPAVRRRQPDGLAERARSSGRCGPALVACGAQLAVLGTGDPALERRLTALAHSHAGQVGCIVGYDEDLAHLIQAGADAVLVPSRFEPCGLTQLCAMRYGAMPVVSKVGGLADTIIDLPRHGAKARPASISR